MNKKKIIVSGSKYAGKYVATASFNQTSVIASGKDPAAVKIQAERKGYRSPVVIYVRKDKVLNIF